MDWRIAVMVADLASEPSLGCSLLSTFGPRSPVVPSVPYCCCCRQRVVGGLSLSHTHTHPPKQNKLCVRGIPARERGPWYVRGVRQRAEKQFRRRIRRRDATARCFVVLCCTGTVLYRTVCCSALL